MNPENVPSDIFRRDDSSFDVGLLRKDVDWVLTKVDWHPRESQISLQHSLEDENPWYSQVGSNWEKVDGRWRIKQLDSDVCHLHPDLKGSYIEHVLGNLPFSPLRSRLMCMPPKKCYSVHKDTTSRWHMAITTDEHARFVFTEDQIVLHIPADGHPYYLDTTREHTALNGSDRDRIHLVMLDPAHSYSESELAEYRW